MDAFKARAVVITGAAGGIGAALARAFAARGARLALADLDEEGLARLATGLEREGVELLTQVTDVSRPESVEALAKICEQRLGGIEVVCNNAGVATAGELAGASLEDWRRTLDVNLWGVIHGIRAFVPRLIARGPGGAVLNTASMAGLVGMQGLGVYSASKFAIVGLSEALYRELRPYGVHVSVLCPMMVDTPMARNSLRVASGDAVPVPSDFAGRLIEPEEVARRALHGLERHQLYILTHPEQRPILQRRAARLEAVFEAEAWL
ncbi:MAG: SDR family oxidoreductase [Myxococcota bacterium]